MYYTKTASEQHGSGFSGDRFMTVYQAAFQQLLHTMPFETGPLHVVYDICQYV